jgi:hypothetical protein
MKIILPQNPSKLRRLTKSEVEILNTDLRLCSNGSEYICPTSGGDFCAGPSLSTNIIIRCGSDGLGQPGNCDDNLAGDPPVGVGNSICWQTSLTSGDAACSKK